MLYHIQDHQKMLPSSFRFDKISFFNFVINN